VLILRLWKEERENDANPAVWRGMIEDVNSGERVYVKNMDEIMLLIRQHIEEMGIDIP
jgi:hypothetical protein